MTLRFRFNRAGTPLFGTNYEFTSESQKGVFLNALVLVLGREVQCLQGKVNENFRPFRLEHALKWLETSGIKKSRSQEFRALTATLVAVTAPPDVTAPPLPVHRPERPDTTYVALLTVAGQTVAGQPLAFSNQGACRELQGLLERMLPTVRQQRVMRVPGRAFTPQRVADWFFQNKGLPNARNVARAVLDHYRRPGSQQSNPSREATRPTPPPSRPAISEPIRVRAAIAQRQAPAGPVARNPQTEVYRIWVGPSMLCDAPLNLGGAGRCNTVVQAIKAGTILSVRSEPDVHGPDVRPDDRNAISAWLSGIPGVDLRRVRERLGFRDPLTLAEATALKAAATLKEQWAQAAERQRCLALTEARERAVRKQQLKADSQLMQVQELTRTHRPLPRSERKPVPGTVSQHLDYDAESGQVARICTEIDRRIHRKIGQTVDSAYIQAINNEDLNSMIQAAESPYYMRMFLQYATGEEKVVCLGESVRDLLLDDVYVAGIGSPLRQLMHKNSRDQTLLTERGEYLKLKLRLRRKVDIENRTIYNLQDDLPLLTDSDESPSDNLDAFSLLGQEYLVQQLSRESSAVARSILSTISERQDELMSSPVDRLLVVNGAPGSGKTAIAYNRVPLLLHESRNQTAKLQERRIAIFAPNQFLLNHLKHVLPRFGLNDVFQTTFEDWAMRVINKNGGRQINEVTDRTGEIILSLTTTPQAKSQAWDRARVLGRLEMERVLRHLLTDHIARALTSLVLKVNVRRVDEPDAAPLAFDLDFAPLFPALDAFRSSEDRAVNLQETLLKRALQCVDEQLTGYRQRLLAEECCLINAREDWDEARKVKEKARVEASRIEAVNPRARLLEKLRSLTPWPNAWEAYLDLVSSPRAVRDAVARVFTIPAERKASAGALYRPLPPKPRKGEAVKPERTDVTELPLVLVLKILLEGPGPNDRALAIRLPTSGRFDYLVVDEGQDMSPLQYALLARYVRKGYAAVFGDLRQSIHGYRGLTSWETVIQSLGRSRKETVQQLTLTFRSTQEITRQANAVLTAINPQLLHAEAVPREGPPVHYIAYGKKQEFHPLLTLEIQRLQANGVRSIGIISRSVEESQDVYKRLQESQTLKIDAHPGNFEDYSGGVAIVPISVAKGLEFDAAIIVNADPGTYRTDTPYDGPLLYTSVTRGLHHLTIFAHKQFSPLLGALPQLPSEICPICNLSVDQHGFHHSPFRQVQTTRKMSEERGPGHHHSEMVRTHDGRFDSYPRFEGDGGSDNSWSDG